MTKAAAAALRLTADPRPVLQRLLEERYKVDSVTLCGSGTSALQLTLDSVTRRKTEGLRLALPAFACYDLVSAAVQRQATLEFYDIDPYTLGPDMDSLARVLKRGVQAVVVAYLYGVPVDWPAIEELAARYGARLIEDAAQGHGGSWRGQLLGSLGSETILSFGRGKGWTGARGGALLCRPARDAWRPVLSSTSELGVLGEAVGQWALAGAALYRLPASVPFLGLGETHYRQPRPSHGMTRAMAALVLASRGVADREAAHRRRVGAWYMSRLQGVPGIHTVAAPAGGKPGYLRFPVVLEGSAREAALGVRLRMLGVASSYPKLLPELGPARPLLASTGDGFPGACVLVGGLFTLPTHSQLGRVEREAMLGLITH